MALDRQLVYVICSCFSRVYGGGIDRGSGLVLFRNQRPWTRSIWSAANIVIGFGSHLCQRDSRCCGRIVVAITEAFDVRGVADYAVGGGLVGLAAIRPDSVRWRHFLRWHCQA